MEPKRKTVTRSNDLRAVKSRRALRQALLSLIASQPLEHITIKQITAEAGVSYPVFFRQYEHKDELLLEIAEEEVRELLGKTYPLSAASDSVKGLVELCQYVQDHRKLWTALLTAGAANAMRSEFARIASEFGRTGPRANPWLPVELASAFVAAGIFEILAWWMNQPEDYPAANVVKLLHTLVVRSLTSPQDIELE